MRQPKNLHLKLPILGCIKIIDFIKPDWARSSLCKNESCLIKGIEIGRTFRLQQISESCQRRKEGKEGKQEKLHITAQFWGNIGQVKGKSLNRSCLL
jgi:hypothetical protein